MTDELANALNENTRLRAALAVSKDPCPYCSLPADEWSECAAGFPGCARADDASGCPEFGAALQLYHLQEAILNIAESCPAPIKMRLRGLFTKLVEENENTQNNSSLG